MYDKWCNVLDAVPAREEALAEEMQKQQTNEQLRLAFAEKANALSGYIQQRASELAEQSMKALGTMEVVSPPSGCVQSLDCTSLPQDQLQALIVFEAETQAQQPEMESVEEIHRQMQAALIFDNKHATVGIEVRGHSGVVLLQHRTSCKHAVLLLAGSAC